MLPGRAGIGAAEGALPGSDQDLSFGRNRHAVNAGDVGRQRRLLPGVSSVSGIENVGASGGHNQVAFGFDRDEISLAQYWAASPGFALVRTGEQSR